MPTSATRKGVAMAYREVGHMQVVEVLRRWQAHESVRAIGRGTGLARNTVRKYRREATRLGLWPDGPQATDQQVRQNAQIGGALQISKRPTMVVNGRMVEGSVTWDTLNNIIKLELGRPKDIALGSADKCCEASIPTIAKQ